MPDETAKLLCTLLPAGATGKGTLAYTYTSSAPQVAAVDAQGNVTGISAGTAVITVTAYNASASGAPLTAQIIITVNDTQTVHLHQR